MQIKLSKGSFTDAGQKYRGKMYVGRVNMNAWEDGQDPETEQPVIKDGVLIALLKTGLRASVEGPPNTIKDGKPLKIYYECSNCSIQWNSIMQDSKCPTCEKPGSITGQDTPDNTTIDGPTLTDEECYKKFTDTLEPQINAVVAEYEAGRTKPQREQAILDDPKLSNALTALEAKVNG